MIQGLGDQNEYLLVFDDGNFEATGSTFTTFNVDDWIAHTPKGILAKNFGTAKLIALLWQSLGLTFFKV